MKNFVELKNVNYTYEKTGFKIRDVNLELSKGQCAILRGSNGSGKTTLGKLIMGILKPNSGSVYVGGQDIPPERFSVLNVMPTILDLMDVPHPPGLDGKTLI